jgi:hypothetical protein
MMWRKKVSARNKDIRNYVLMNFKYYWNENHYLDESKITDNK